MTTTTAYGAGYNQPIAAPYNQPMPAGYAQPVPPGYNAAAAPPPYPGTQYPTGQQAPPMAYPAQ